MRASALQYVRKLSGMQRPSRGNEAAFERALERVFEATRELLAELETHGPPRSREEERRKAVERGPSVSLCNSSPPPPPPMFLLRA